jgi:hypothetical protein
VSEKQTYRIPVSNGILEHCQKIGASIWFFLWCVDKTTKEITDESGNRIGKVLGGKPICDKEVADVLGVSKWTVARWREQLSMLGYIKATRTPNGHALLVAKSKKWAASDSE